MSGKSCFLKALAGLLPRSDLLQGEVRYGGLTYDEAIAQEIYPGHMVQYTGMCYMLQVFVCYASSDG
jgi:ABC-type multidrug transport system ATPase subunit